MKTFINNHKSTAAEGDLWSVFYSEATLRKMLKIKGCEGIRFHLGKDNDGKTVIFAEPTDGAGRSLPATTERSITDNGEGQFFSVDGNCPLDCPPDNGG
jgi:hypothetical protein